MMSYMIPVVAGLVVIGLVWLLASRWARTSAKGGKDREGDIEVRPAPISLHAQLKRLRKRLARKRE
jgi:hypothetical protein